MPSGDDNVWPDMDITHIAMAKTVTLLIILFILKVNIYELVLLKSLELNYSANIVNSTDIYIIFCPTFL